MIKLPIKSYAIVKHVGSMVASDKRRNSHEGAGLSVSRHPEEWQEIARGFVHGDTWSGKRSDGTKGRFADYHRITKATLADVERWAVEAGLATPTEIHCFSYEDDELECTRSFAFATEEERDQEAEEHEDAEFFTEPGIAATDALREISRHDCGPGFATEMALLAYIDRETDLDGCWWNDVLDVDALSAPRGVITPSRISAWTFRKE